MTTSPVPFKPTPKLVRKILDTVDAGLCSGMGQPVPGKMCVEAAVCYAMGLPHSDEPTCVGSAVRAFKIQLNDSSWSSNKARAAGMRRVAIAQLGSEQIDQVQFAKELAKLTIQTILPATLTAVMTMPGFPADHKAPMEAAIARCVAEGSRAASWAASEAASEAASRAASEAASRAASEAASEAASRAASEAASEAASRAALWAASAASEAASAASEAASRAASEAARRAASAASEAASWAATAASRAASEAASRAASWAASDKMLALAAEVGVKALQECNSPGCEFLYLAD